MTILLELPKEILDKYSEIAKMDKRSRKNFMEKVLIDFFNQPTKPKEPEKQFQEEYKPPTSNAPDYMEKLFQQISNQKDKK